MGRRRPARSCFALITTQKFLTPFALWVPTTGGSSKGLLLELARVIGQHPDLARKIERVFFDGERSLRAIFRNGWFVRKPLFCQAASKGRCESNFAADCVRHGLANGVMASDRFANESPAEQTIRREIAFAPSL